ncbi:hypothetical protein [Haliangium ochraceum]|uniref:Cip1-like core domain-containing protein n=1 Tax=Haliangium ochraceum (strain DSM 14365 / JCM 11303 / SMP-2) TaxID=502025 RepID=D0LX02_HALO1|nr:hypothetical protein [Haliangium ochraceum]ACY14249.1 hypothetical protein Hoch_1699 [Haliangium ochraceum DSM 14365]
MFQPSRLRGRCPNRALSPAPRASALHPHTRAPALARTQTPARVRPRSRLAQHGPLPWALSALALALALLLAPGCGDGGAGSDGGGPGPVDGGGSPMLDAAPADANGALDAPGAVADAGEETPPLACDDLPLCDDFEAATAGGEPPAPWVVGAPNCSNGGSVSVDDEVAHSGSRSVRVSAGGSYCDHIFLAAEAPFAALGELVYGRFFVRLDEALGEGHTTFMTMRDDSEERDLRMGGQTQILMWNRESDDATLPALSPTGRAASVALSAQTWYCVEFAVDGAAGTIETWVDGARIEGLIVDGEPTADIDEPWLRKTGWAPQLSDFKLGWESYAGQANTLWFDDVALSNQPIGCGS